MSMITLLETLFIGPLKLVFELIFVIANRLLGENPGFAIIALSLLMNIMVLPLYQRADTMQEAARDKDAQLRDGVAHIKKNFSGDERMMILQTYYRQNDYRPTDVLHGSVSLLLEVPFFMAAYQFLSNLELLNNVSFGPIADLGAPDGMLMLGGVAINVLPILMTLVNVISSAIYLKGFPLKTKIQLYGMAAFFLVFLYNSPSGLVFYWTLNNLFSLGKNLVMKVKPIRTAGRWLLFAAGIAAVALGFVRPMSATRRLFAVCAGAALMLPSVTASLKGHIRISLGCAAKAGTACQPDNHLFALGSAFLTVLIGMLIPSTYIGASPLEFVDPSYYHDPLLYILVTACMAAGFFLVWLRVFYWLASDKVKIWIDRGVWILCGVMLVNYMFFGRHLGILQSNLQYENGDLLFTSAEKLLNPFVLTALCFAMLAFVIKWKRNAVSCLLVAVIALGSMSVWNMITIRKTTAETARMAKETQQADDLKFKMSKDGKNVVVIMLDRAMGQTIPYIFNEKPELRDSFDGFVYYQNTTSYGGHTIFTVPSLMGGYEYTPERINQRDQERLVDKHNEAIRVMPEIFTENGFEVTLINPPLANYQWIPDLTVYEDYPDINAFNTTGLFLDIQQKQLQIDANRRNFFCFSLMKSMPVALQRTIYAGGTYNQPAAENVPIYPQVQYGVSVAEGESTEFLDHYFALESMETMTKVSDDNENTFVFLCSEITHIPTLLQTPDYVPSQKVDNQLYDAQNTQRFMVDGKMANTEDTRTSAFYHANMAAMLLLGEWFDYLRDNDIYDNTRIILVSDHGVGIDLYGNQNLDVGEETPVDLSIYNVLLMVKDFDSHGFSKSETFMTNADVPQLAMAEVIDNPINPFTGNPISMNGKDGDSLYIYTGSDWEIPKKDACTFHEEYWLRAGKNILEPTDWVRNREKTTLPEAGSFVS